MSVNKTKVLQVIAEARNLPGALQGASSTAEFYFDDVNGVDALCSVPISQISRRPFKVRCGGRIQGAAGTTPDITINLDAGNSTTIASNTTIFTSGSLVLDNDTTIQTFYLEATLLLGAVDSKLQGYGSGWVNNTVVAAAASTESVEDLVANGVLHFKVSGTMSESIAAHGAFLDFLEVIADAPSV